MIDTKQFIINILIVYHDAFFTSWNIFKMQKIIYELTIDIYLQHGAEGPIIQ